MSGGGKAVDEDNDMTARGMTECGVKKYYSTCGIIEYHPVILTFRFTATIKPPAL